MRILFPVSPDLIRPTVAVLAAGRTGVLTTAVLVAGLLLLGGLGLIAAGPLGKLETPRPAASPPRQDLYGDPLPPGAIARMGSIRWRHVDEFPPHLHVVPSPTGQVAATVNRGDSEKRMIRVWDLSDGRRLCEFPWEYTLSGGNLQFTSDGSRLMVIGDRGVIRFHDPRTGKVVAESKPVVEKDDLQKDKSRSYSNTAHMLTADGRWVVTSDFGKLILTEIITDPATTPHQVTLEPPADNYIFRGSNFTCDGRTLVFSHCGYGRDILRWDVRTGKLSRKTTIKSKTILSASTRDGKRVATWRFDMPPDDVLRVWDSETGAEAVELEDAERGAYGSIQFSPDGKLLVVATWRKEKTVTVWELDRGKKVGRVTVPAWTWEVYLLPDGKTILATSGLGMMFGTWDIATGRGLSPIAGHESPVRHVAFTPDGKTLLTASTDPEERVTAWDAATGRKRQELAAPHGPTPFMVTPSVPFVLTPAGAVVTTGKGTLVWTDMKTGRELRRVTPKPIVTAMDQHDYFHAERLSLTHDPQTGRPAVLGLHSFGPSELLSLQKYEWKDVITLWDAESGELLAHRAYSRGRDDRHRVVVSPDGRWLARPSHAPTTDISVDLSPALGGRGSFQLPHPGDDSPHSLFTPDGQTLITVTRKRSPANAAGDPVESHTVRLWEVRTGKKRLEFPVPFGPSTPVVSPDGRFLAAERIDTRTISVWDLATGAEVAKRSGYGPLVQTLAFRPDGTALASGHADGTALVWDLSGLPGARPMVTNREAAWTDLASADAGKAYRAILSLAADAGGVAFLRDKVKPAPEIPASRIQKLVKTLNADKYATREAATTALKNLGDAADAELQALVRGELSLEQRRRIADVLESRGFPEANPDRLRVLRCVEVLERVGSAEARSLLAELAKGASGSRLTREAAGAVRRHSMQSP